MIAYDETYLARARVTLGNMLDWGVNSMGLEIGNLWQRFLVSGYASRFGRGESRVLAGMSGIELTYAVTLPGADEPLLVEVHEGKMPGALCSEPEKSIVVEHRMTDPLPWENDKQIGFEFNDGKSPEYWTGWALAYYQWATGLAFREITEAVDIGSIVQMYFPYHEMDIRHFCDRMDELRAAAARRAAGTRLKRRRLEVGFTQAAVAAQTGIPLRTVQQYEQGQKNINVARSEYVVALARVLYCEPGELLESCVFGNL